MRAGLPGVVRPAGAGRGLAVVVRSLAGRVPRGSGRTRVRAVRALGLLGVSRSGQWNAGRVAGRWWVSNFGAVALQLGMSSSDWL
jgi:hypothetical protein